MEFLDITSLYYKKIRLFKNLRGFNITPLNRPLYALEPTCISVKVRSARSPQAKGTIKVTFACGPLLGYNRK